MTAAATTTAPRAAAAVRPRFYLWIAVAMAATAFIGFAPTFWVPMAQGVPMRIAVIAVHGMLFFGWTLLLIYQTWLVASGNTARHRDIGLIGISLATAMVIFGALAAINAGKRAAQDGFAAAGEAFLVVPLAPLLCFAGLVTAAIVNVRRPEWHKRLMLAGSAVLLDAPIARLFIAYVVMGGHLPPFQGTAGLAGIPGPPPPAAAVLAPALLCLLFIGAGMIYDWRTQRKVHPAYLWAGGIALGVDVLKIPLSDTALWRGFAHWLVSLAT